MDTLSFHTLGKGPLVLKRLTRLCFSYSKFLGERGGSSNAFTSSEHTNFHFEVPSEHFPEALTR